MARPTVERAQVEQLTRQLQERAAVSATRYAALSTLEQIALPDRVQHLWRYTDPAQLLPGGALLAAGPVVPAAMPALPEGGAALLIQPGAALRSECSDQARQAGLELLPLSAAARFAERMTGAVPAGHGLLEAINAASWSSGALVRVPKGCRIPGLIRIAVDASALVSTTRVMLLLEEGAEATVIEEIQGGGAGHLFNGVSEAFVGPQARLHHGVVQRLSSGARGHLALRALLERQAHYQGLLFSFGGSLFKADLGAQLDGEGAESTLVGLALAQQRQRMDLHTVHQHSAPHTLSNIDFKAALNGRASSAYTGVIRIAERAKHSEAYQESRNLLLSSRARAETIPELEILTDEVSCTHGATVAPVEQEQLTYLQSRGISRPSALRLIVGGFLQQTVDRLPAAMRGEVEELVEARLAQVAGVVS